MTAAKITAAEARHPSGPTNAEYGMELPTVVLSRFCGSIDDVADIIKWATALRDSGWLDGPKWDIYRTLTATGLPEIVLTDGRPPLIVRIGDHLVYRYGQLLVLDAAQYASRVRRLPMTSQGATGFPTTARCG